MDAVDAILDALLEPVYEESGPKRRGGETAYPRIVFTKDEIINDLKASFDVVDFLPTAELDVLMAPPIRILSIPRSPRKLTSGSDTRFKVFSEALPVVRQIVLDFALKVLRAYPAYAWRTRQAFLDGLLGCSDVDLLAFFTFADLHPSPSLLEVVDAQLCQRMHSIRFALTDLKINEPALGKKRRNGSTKKTSVKGLDVVVEYLTRSPCTPTDATLVEAFGLYRVMHGLGLKDRFDLLKAFYSTMVLRYAAEFHPLLPVLLNILSAEQGLETRAIRTQVSLLIHPRRTPFPLKESRAVDATTENSPSIAVAAKISVSVPLPPVTLAMPRVPEVVAVASAPKAVENIVLETSAFGQAVQAAIQAPAEPKIAVDEAVTEDLPALIIE